MDDIYKNIEDYNLDEKRKSLIVFDDMIADMLSTVDICYLELARDQQNSSR